MSEISERYDRLADDFAATIAGVPPDRWEARSPCPDWSARDVVRHVVETCGMFLGFVGRELGDVPLVDDDPAAAFAAGRAAVSAGLEDPAVAGAEFDGFSGRSSFEDGVDRFLCGDLVVHRWDLARATGQQAQLPADDLRRVHDMVVAFGDAARAQGAFGPAVDVPEGADEQTRMLAFLGRDAGS